MSRRRCYGGRDAVARIIVPHSVIPLLLLLAHGFGKDPRRVPSPLVGRVAYKHIGEIDMETLVDKIEALLPIPHARAERP